MIFYPLSTHSRPSAHGPHSGFSSPIHTLRKSTGEHWWNSSSLFLQVPCRSSIVGSITQQPSPQSPSLSQIAPKLMLKRKSATVESYGRFDCVTEQHYGSIFFTCLWSVYNVKVVFLFTKVYILLNLFYCLKDEFGFYENKIIFTTLF